MTRKALLEELLTARRLRGLIDIERRAADDARRTAQHFTRIAESCDGAAAVMQERLETLEDCAAMEREFGIDVEIARGTEAA